MPPRTVTAHNRLEKPVIAAHITAIGCDASSLTICARRTSMFLRASSHARGWLGSAHPY
jgi:hypothetical protein